MTDSSATDDLGPLGSPRSPRGLRRPVLVSLSVALAVCLASLLLYLTVYVPFRDVERERAIEAMARVEAGLNDHLQRLATLSRDWGIWNDAYEFMGNHNQEFVDANFTPATIEGAKLNLICIPDPDGVVVASVGYDLHDRKQVQVSPSFRERLEGDLKQLLIFPTLQTTHTGLVLTDRGPLMVAASPILTGQGDGPIRGAVILGRLLDESVLKDLPRPSEFELRLKSTESNPSPVQQPSERITTGRKQYSLFERSSGVLTIESELTDITGRSVLVLEGSLRRDLSRRGTSALILSLVGVLILGIALLFAISRFTGRRVPEEVLVELAGKSAGNKAREGWGGALILMMAGLMLSVVACYTVGMEESIRRREAFEHQAGAIFNALQDQHSDQLAELMGIARFIMVNEKLTPEKFRAYTGPVFDQLRGVQVLGWAVRVGGGDWDLRAPEAGVSGWEGLRITERLEDGRYILAGERPEYFPFFCVEPLIGNEKSIGYDLGSDAELGAAIGKARDTGNPVAAAPHGSILNSTETQRPVLLLVPTYRGGQIPPTIDGRKERFSGFVIGVFNPEQSIKATLRDQKIDDLALTVKDVTEPNDPRLLFNKGMTVGNGLTWGDRLDLDGRTWEVRVGATSDFLRRHQPRVSWAVLAVGLLLTTIVTFLSVGGTRRRRFLESLLSRVEVEELQQAIRFRRHILPPVALVLLMGLLGFAWWFQAYNDRLETARTLAVAKQAGKTWQTLLDRERAVMQDQLGVMEKVPGLAEALRTRDRQGLMRMLQPHFDRIHKEYDIDALHIILPDSEVLLRVHDPLRLGDVFDRFTVREAIRTQHETWGIDPGSQGTYTFRCVHPLWLNETLVGFLELGKPVEALAQQLQRGTGLELLLVSPKTLTTRENYEAGRRKTGTSGDWDALRDYVVLKQTIPAIPADLSAHLGEDSGGGTNELFRLTGNGISWSCSVLPLVDASRKEMARMIIMRDVSATEAMRNQVLAYSLLVIGGLSVLAYLSLSSLLGKVERRLIRAVAGREREAEARRRTEEHLAATLRSIGDGVISTDTFGCVSEMNRVAEILTGWTQAEARGRPIDEILIMVHGQTRQVVENPIPHVLREGQTVELPDHTALIRRDGTTVQIADSAAPILSANGELQGAVLVFRDVTEERRLREELQESENFQRTLLDNIATGVIVVDATTHVIEHANLCAAGMLGAPLESVMGHRCQQFLCPSPECYGIDTSQDHDLAPAERVMLCADGSTKLTLKTVKRMRIRGEDKLIESFTDVTQLKLAEEELRKLSRAVEQSPVSILITDLNGAISYANPRFSEATGYALDEVKGQNAYWLLAAETSEERHKELFEVIRSGGEWRGEFHAKRRNGELYWEQVSVSALRDAQGLVRHFISVAEDITYRKQAEEELRRSKDELEALNGQLEQAIDQARSMALKADEANAAKSQFLANMSHEIRTPMNGVTGMIELLLKTGLDSHQKRCAEMARSAAYSLLNVLNDILDLSKIEANKLELDLDDLDLQSLVEEVTQLFGPQAAKNGVEVITAYRPGTPRWFVGDALRIRQILTNLAGNAVKFTSQGHVLISAHSETEPDRPEMVHLTVSDTGTGISEEAQGRLFQAFSQGDGSITRNFGGTGLGLAICRKLTEKMNGRLWVESVPGHGSTFHCTLPLPPSEHPATDTVEDPANLSGLQVLIVDDNSASGAMLNEMISKWGMRPTSAEDGRTALEILSHLDEKPIDILVLDSDLPDMDGFELFKQSRDLMGSSRPTVLMLASGGHEREISRCREAGITTYLPKPIRQADLLRALRVAAGVDLEIAKEVGETSPPPAKTQPLRILLAEDMPINQRVAVQMLEGWGHQVDVARTGLEAVRAAYEVEYDLVLMDVQMPEMDGFEATAKIRSLPDRTDLVIIAMTAHAMREDRERCLRAGMTDYVTKPIDWNLLFDKINGLELRTTQPECIVSESHGRCDELPEGEWLLDQFNQDQDFLNEMINLLFEDIPERIEKLAQAVDSGNSAQLSSEAHAFKGTLGNFGKGAAFEAARNLEEIGRAGTLGEADPAMDILRREVQRLQSHLEGLAF